jgi:hypothetical protein
MELKTWSRLVEFDKVYFLARKCCDDRVLPCPEQELCRVCTDLYTHRKSYQNKKIQIEYPEPTVPHERREVSCDVTIHHIHQILTSQRRA